ncbi:MAG: response regulator [Planctomycetota bacterium]|jgi:DNA-binding NtrC family response regulator
MIRVLLVENEARVAESLEAHFRAHGMETVVCATGEEALAAPPCDVVVADLRLPGMSGVDLVEQLKERDRLRGAGDLDLRRRVRALERSLFREALRRAGGRKARAARLLGIDASNWAYHAKRLDLQ